MSHDLAYLKNEYRRKADRILADRAFQRTFAAQAEPDERTAALITACCMISKITFEKCFDRITKTVRKISQVKNVAKKTSRKHKVSKIQKKKIIRKNTKKDDAKQ